MPNLVEHAVKYAKAGFSVLPMSVDKTPLIKFKDKPPMTEAEIRDFWSKHPDALIAIRTIDFFVVDIDKHDGGEDGFASFRLFNEKHPEAYKPTLSQWTAGGGFQMLYLKRDGMRVKQNIGWLDGVDIKAHQNNYIIVPPSERNGKQYKWQDLKQPMMTAPKELIKLINYKSKDASINGKGYQVRTVGQREAKIAEAVSMIANGLGDTGSRNDSLAGMVGVLLSIGVDAMTVAQLAVEANDNTVDSLPPNEVAKTINSIIDSEQRKRG